jgi:hypothetical protein
VRVSPLFDPRPEPHAANGEIGLWRREVVVRLNELVDALTRDAEKFGNLRHEAGAASARPHTATPPPARAMARHDVH